MSNGRRVQGRWFRVLKPRYMHLPLSGRGAAITGGRFNRQGQAAFYLSADPQTAYAEYTASGYDKPGLMCSYDVDARPVADLADASERNAFGIREADLGRMWIDALDPATHVIADTLIEAGFTGALFASIQRPEGINLVLWRWEHGDSLVRLVDRLAEAPTKPAG